jgi:hypothetical protein
MLAAQVDWKRRSLTVKWDTDSKHRRLPTAIASLKAWDRQVPAVPEELRLLNACALRGPKILSLGSFVASVSAKLHDCLKLASTHLRTAP